MLWNKRVGVKYKKNQCKINTLCLVTSEAVGPVSVPCDECVIATLKSVCRPSVLAMVLHCSNTAQEENACLLALEGLIMCI